MPAGAAFSNGQSDRPAAFIIELRLTEERPETNAEAANESRLLRTQVHLIIRPLRARDRRRTDLAVSARQLASSVKSYLMANDDEEIVVEPPTPADDPVAAVAGFARVNLAGSTPPERHVASVGGFRYAAQSASKCTAGGTRVSAFFPAWLAPTIFFRCFRGGIINGLRTAAIAVSVRCSRTAYRRQDDGNPSRQAPCRLRHQPEQGARRDDARQPTDRIADRQTRQRAGKHSHRGAKQRRRPCQPLAVLDDSGQRQGGAPVGKLADAIKTELAGFDAFKEALTKAGVGRFGSGWAWLSLDKNKKLVVESTPNQDSPIMHGNVPVLGLDVWEHAYYLKYQNRRPDYIAAFWNVVDWSCGQPPLRSGVEVTSASTQSVGVGFAGLLVGHSKPRAAEMTAARGFLVALGWRVDAISLALPAALASPAFAGLPISSGGAMRWIALLLSRRLATPLARLHQRC